MNVFLIPIVAIFATLCWGAPASKKIEKTAYNYPYHISIQTKEGNEYHHTCGGAILSPYWVITAAHCIGLSLLQSRVVAGAYNLSNLDQSVVQIRNIDLYKIVIHPNYQNEILNDIALLKMTKPFEFNQFVQPLPISKASSVSDNETNLFSGWRMKNSILQTANVSILSFDDCYQRLHPIYGDYLILKQDIHLCIVGNDNPCVLNDGGPLIQDNKLVGLLSWLLSSCANDGIPTIFTNSGFYMNFIKEHVNDLPSYS